MIERKSALPARAGARPAAHSSGRLLGLFLATCACASEPGVATPKRQSPATDLLPECDAAPAQHLVGKQIGKGIEAKMRQITGASEIRWIRPGDVIAMDYHTSRLNVEIDQRNRIIRLYCG